MSKTRSNSKSTQQRDSSKNNDEQLELADSTHAGEASPVNEPKSSGKPAPKSAPSKKPTSSQASAGASGSGTSYRSEVGDTNAAASQGTSGDSRGKSTGFETILGRVFVDRGFVTSEELQAARELQRQRIEGETPSELGDLLIENQYITARQLERIRTEVEAEKSTQQIPGYKIKKKLGHGAMATVFLGRQLSLDRLVAIKVLPSKFSNNEKFIERFYKEGRAAAQLNHPHIVGAFDVGKAGDHHYFVMEYVDGDTVHDRILKTKRMNEENAIRIITEVAEALKHAHEKGFIHRDIKPKNIMLTTKGTAKLADLGLARALSDKEAAEAEAGRAYGTPYYISPEQIRGEVEIGPPADIYGLGATFYHMVTGKVPFDGKNPSSVMHKHLKNKLRPPDHVNPKLSPGTAQVIEMMMQKSRRKRYQNCDDLLVDLRKIAAGESPHFAKAEHDLSGVTTDLDEAVEVAPLTVQEDEKNSGPSLSDPLFLMTAMAAIVSLLINVVLAIALLTGSDNSGGENVAGGGGGNNNETPVVEGPKSPGLYGTWENGNFYGGSMRMTFNENGTLLWETWGAPNFAGSPARSLNRAYVVTDDDRIVVKATSGDATFTYLIDGFTLRLRSSDGTNYDLRRQ